MIRRCRYANDNEGGQFLEHEEITISQTELAQLVKDNRVRIVHGHALDDLEPHVLVLKVSK